MCLGEESCPWMNAATAGGLLGGEVTATVTHSSKNREDGNCDFVRRQRSLVYELAIQVETMTPPEKLSCGGQSTALKAIGNEAYACSLAKEGEISETVVGRVRDRAFIVRASTNDRSALQSSFREKAKTAAEQVAGNLF